MSFRTHISNSQQSATKLKSNVTLPVFLKFEEKCRKENKAMPTYSCSYSIGHVKLFLSHKMNFSLFPLCSFCSNVLIMDLHCYSVERSIFKKKLLINFNSTTCAYEQRIFSFLLFFSFWVSSNIGHALDLWIFSQTFLFMRLTFWSLYDLSERFICN